MKRERYTLKKSLKHLLDKTTVSQKGNHEDNLKESNDATDCNLKKSESDFLNSFIFTQIPNSTVLAWTEQ